MPDLPTGTVTFLFTDIEGSTRLWEQQPARMRDLLGGRAARSNAREGRPATAAAAGRPF